MLSAPWIVGPITPCSRKVKVEGLLPGTGVHLLANGAEVGGGAADRPDEMIGLATGINLEPGWLITAWQETDADESGETPIPYRVLDYPTREALGQIFLLAQPVACGTCLGIGGIVPGSTVEVNIPGRPPISVVADWTEVHISVPDGLPPDPFTVQQTACGTDVQRKGPVVTFPPPLRLHQSGPHLPAPLFEPAVRECQQLLRLTRVQPGATIKLTRGGVTTTHCFGSSDGDIFLPHVGLVKQEEIELSQEYSVRECRREGKKDKHTVPQGPPGAPWFAETPALRNAFVTIGGLVPGATVHIFADGASEPLVLGAATRGVSAINLPVGWNARRLSVRQSICDDTDLSAPTSTEVLRLTAPLALDFRTPPLYGHHQANSVAVKVAGRADWEPGLAAGTLVRVFSRLWHGVIGEAVATGDHYTDVSLWLPLVDGDDIHAEALRCGLSTASSPPIPVKVNPDEFLPSELAVTPDDCGGSVWVHSYTSVMVDLEEVEAANFDFDTAGVLLTSARVNRRDMPVPLPESPLPRGTLLRVRARRCGERPHPGKIRMLGDFGLRYDADSAFRICQLTGGSDPGGRPHLNDTRGIALNGTDLGIPVDHRGKLWFFFGDASSFGFLGEEFWGDNDPFAWTTDGPEPDGPRLQFVADDTKFYIELLEEAVGAAIGGVVAGALGLAFGGVAAALAAGFAGAALGALIGFFIDIVPDKTFRRLTVDGLPPLERFEVPAGGFSYNGLLHLFIARHQTKDDGMERMRLSHLAVSKSPDPADNFRRFGDVSSTLSDVIFPAGMWLVHVSPTVVRNSEVPGLPSSSGDGLVMFGTGLYHSSNLYVAWAPLTPGVAPPPASTWLLLTNTATGTAWLPPNPATIGSMGFGPKPLLPGTPNLGELSASWSPALSRWILTTSAPNQVELRVARKPSEPWTNMTLIFNALDPRACADNPVPPAPPVWLGLEDDKGVKSVLYAPYHIPRWMRFDRSTRKLTIYYTLSLSAPTYNPQLMRARLTCY